MVKSMKTPLKNKSSKVFYWCLMVIILPIAWILFLPRIKGRKKIPKGGAIFAGNHIRSLDSVMILVAIWRPLQFLSKIEIFSWPVIGWLVKRLNMIPVDRKAVGKNSGAIDAAVAYLNQDKSVGIFPEGTAKKPRNELLPFKFGAVKMAQKSGKIIVPFAIYGHYWPFCHTINVVIGEPIDISGLEITEANELLRNQIAGLLTNNGQKIIVKGDK